MPLPFEAETNRRGFRWGMWFSALLVVLLLTTGYLWTWLNTTPSTFTPNTTITVTEGASISTIAQTLKTAGLIRSAEYFKIICALNHAEGMIQAGNYTFTSPATTEELARMLIAGTGRSPFNMVTFPEGFTVKAFASYVPTTLELPDENQLRTAEGYLFPDTYELTDSTDGVELIERMRANFDAKLAPYKDDIAQSGMTIEEIVILASIIEREAKDRESKHLVSGVLHNRLKAGMPLQVDATFHYILGKTSAELTMEDLHMDSPYNTYTNSGLPPTPIANPGLDAIDAALRPTKTDYFYYLTDANDTFHYAVTFDEHRENKKRYLQ